MSRSKSKRKDKIYYFHCKEYGHIKKNCLERVDMRKCDNLSTTIAKEQGEYIGDIISL